VSTRANAADARSNLLNIIVPLAFHQAFKKACSFNYFKLALSQFATINLNQQATMPFNLANVVQIYRRHKIASILWLKNILFLLPFYFY
jgi:hypothetical protein